MKIVVLDGYVLNPGDLSWESLGAIGTVKIYDRTPVSEVISRIGNATAIFINKVEITRAIMKACPQLKYIGVFATGYNVVDIKAAADLGITVCNVPSYSTSAVTQFVFALLLEIAHHTGDHNISVKAGAWSKSSDFCYWNYPMFELQGKTIGIIGYGRIGKSVTSLAVAFGMKVLVYTRSKYDDNENIRFVSYNSLLKESDVISLHCPLFPETRGMLDKVSLYKCRDGVIIINTSRGGLVVEKAVAMALEKGKVGYYAADVVSEEPIKDNNPLLHSPNTILTPHIAWASLETRERLMNTAIENLKSFISGNPRNVVT